MRSERIRRREGMPSLEKNVEEVVKGLNSTLAFPEEPERGGVNLREYFCGIGNLDPSTCYGAMYKVFTHKYLLKNVLKNLHLLNHLHALGILEKCPRILDIGSGPGTFALSLLLWLQNHSEKELNFEVVMVDAVEQFFDIAQELWKNTNLPNKKKIKLVFRKFHVRGDLALSFQKEDMIVLSNSLGEIMRSPNVNKEKVQSDLASSNCPIVVIDYPHKSLYSVFEQFAHAMRPRYSPMIFEENSKRCPSDEWTHVVAPRGPWERHLFQEPGRKRLEFLESIWLPKNQDKWQDIISAHDIVRVYKIAWEKHNLDLVSELFTNDAVYQEKKDEVVFHGLEEILRYWQLNAEQQENVHFNPVRIDVRMHTVYVIWEASFFRRDLSKWFYLNGEFTAELKRNQIQSFCETFFTEKSSREKNKDSVFAWCNDSLENGWSASGSVCSKNV